jgi:FAD/FMN-containing dehydrogenase
VLHWCDAWLPVHRTRPEPAFLAKLVEPPADPAARAVVHDIRRRLVDLFAEHGAASNQLGKTYHWLSRLEPATAALLRAHKAAVDPAGLLNPGALEFEGTT